MRSNVNKSNIKNTDELTFVPFISEHVNQLDVFYKGNRIAIIDGLSAPLLWTAKNGSNVPIRVIEYIESVVKGNII